MLLSLCLWLYITIICFTWGIIVCRFFTRGEAMQSILFPHFSLICLLGLTATGTLALYLSLYFPLTWITHVAIVLPVIACWSYTPLRKTMWHLLSGSLPSGLINTTLLVVLILMTLSIASSPIIHPDTLSYHIQSIRWLEQFRAVPGIVNVDTELGLQSLWFAAHAIFRPEYSKEHFTLFLNGAVLGWFFIYVCSRKISVKYFILYLLPLLVFTFLSWTQIRLTAASASPDFIVVLYILAAATLYLDKEKDSRLTQMAAIAFAVTAISIKMSALVIILLPLTMIFFFAKKRQYRAAIRGILLCVILLTPVLVRNSIATGYPLFPSSVLQLDVEWKYPGEQLEAFRSYIRAYARWPSVVEKNAGAGWVRDWWSQLAIADRGLLVTVILSLLALLFNIRRISSIIRARELILLIIAVAGAVVWWTMAPDPRFGTAYLLLIVLLSVKIVTRIYNPVMLSRKGLWNAGILLIILSVAGYTTYRFYRFTRADEIIYPAGITLPAFATTGCNGVPVNYPLTDTICGSIPAPCIPDTCTYILPLGAAVEDGFRKKQ